MCQILTNWFPCIAFHAVIIKVSWRAPVMPEKKRVMVSCRDLTERHVACMLTNHSCVVLLAVHLTALIVPLLLR